MDEPGASRRGSLRGSHHPGAHAPADAVVPEPVLPDRAPASPSSLAFPRSRRRLFSRAPEKRPTAVAARVGHEEPREDVADRVHQPDDERGVRLRRLLQQHVERRLGPGDEPSLERQRVGFAPGRQDGIHRTSQTSQAPVPRGPAEQPRGEVPARAIAEALRLADVEHGAVLGEPPVHPSLGGEIRQLSTERRQVRRVDAEGSEDVLRG